MSNVHDMNIHKVLNHGRRKRKRGRERKRRKKKRRERRKTKKTSGKKGAEMKAIS